MNASIWLRFHHCFYTSKKHRNTLTHGDRVTRKQSEGWVVETSEGYDQPLNTRGGKVFPLTDGTVLRDYAPQRIWWSLSSRFWHLDARCKRLCRPMAWMNARWLRGATARASSVNGCIRPSSSKDALDETRCPCQT